MSDVGLARTGRFAAAYAVLAALIGGALYVWLDLVDQMLQDWALHNVAGGVSIGVLAGLIVARHPRNAAVWALLATAAFQSTTALGLGLGQWHLAALGLPSELALAVPSDLPWTTAMVMQLNMWVWLPGMFLMVTLALLLFPDGRPPGPRWRWVAWLTLGSIAVISGLLIWNGRPSQHLAVHGDEPLVGVALPLMVIFAAGVVGLTVSVIASLAAVVHRYRSSSGVVRQQVRWIAWGAAIFVGGLVVLFPLALVPDFGLDPLRVGAAVLMPIFIGSYVLAIARYRLYEIDRIISRTASYAVVTAVLLTIYLGLVLSLQVVLAPFTGGSELAVAGSTLAVAMGFRPVRARVQAIVDRRFNRTVYDAERTVSAFSGDLRDEVDVGALQERLTAVTAAAVQPAHVAVWSAEPEEPG